MMLEQTIQTDQLSSFFTDITIKHRVMPTKTAIWKDSFPILTAKKSVAFGRSCDQPTRSRFSAVFLGPRANAELVPKFHVALHTSHVALPMVILEISHCTNVTSK
jgi:hypothetical protein